MLLHTTFFLLLFPMQKILTVLASNYPHYCMIDKWIYLSDVCTLNQFNNGMCYVTPFSLATLIVMSSQKNMDSKKTIERP